MIHIQTTSIKINCIKYLNGGYHGTYGTPLDPPLPTPRRAAPRGHRRRRFLGPAQIGLIKRVVPARNGQQI